MPTVQPHSLIDEAGNEVIWTIDLETGAYVEPPHYGRRAQTRFTWDADGQQKIWEVDYNEGGPYNLRNGAKVATSLIDANGQEKVWDIDPQTGAALRVRDGRGPITVRTVDTNGQTKLWETDWKGAGVYNLRNGPPNQTPTNGQIDVVKPSTPPPSSGGSGGGYTPPPAPPPPVVLPPPVVSPSMKNFTHPVSGASGQIPDAWQRVGTDSSGNPVFQLRDADNVVKQWALNGELQAVNMTTVPTLGVYVPSAAPATTEKKSSGRALLGLALIGGALWYFWNQSRQRNPAPRRSRRRRSA